jgi:hypothetical protein
MPPVSDDGWHPRKHGARSIRSGDAFRGFGLEIRISKPGIPEKSSLGRPKDRRFNRASLSVGGPVARVNRRFSAAPGCSARWWWHFRAGTEAKVVARGQAGGGRYEPARRRTQTSGGGGYQLRRWSNSKAGAGGSSGSAAGSCSASVAARRHHAPGDVAAGVHAAAGSPNAAPAASVSTAKFSPFKVCFTASNHATYGTAMGREPSRSR